MIGRFYKALCGGLLALLSIAARAELPADWQAATLTRSASFELTSRYTGQHYRIFVGLPAGKPPANGYPVLWMLDGNVSFPLTELVRADRPVAGRQPVDGLVVAVGYASGAAFDVDARAADYTPATTAPTGDKLSPRHGGADAFLDFLTLELRPLIAKQFPLDPNRHTLFGFSYGGLFTLYTLTTRRHAFARYWAASPSLWYGQRHLAGLLEKAGSRANGTPRRVTITVGREEEFPTDALSTERRAHLAERAMVSNVETFTKRLGELQPDWVIQSRIVPGHDHLDMLMHGARRVLEFAFAP